MAETLADFDVEEFRLPRSLYGEIPTRQLLGLRRENHSFGVRFHSPGSRSPPGSQAPVSLWRWPLDSSGADILGNRPGAWPKSDGEPAWRSDPLGRLSGP
jgi:hypothetical protein